MTSSSEEEEIRKMEKELQRRKSQREQRIREQGNNKLLKTTPLEANTSSLPCLSCKREGINRLPIPSVEESTYSGKEETELIRSQDAVGKQPNAFSDNQQVKEDTSDNVHQKKCVSKKENVEKNETLPGKTFQKRQGTTDKGKKYEDLITANVALQMVCDSKIKDFNISTNDEKFGDFDDVVIEIETHQGIETKALQLKHTNNRRQLTINQLTSKTGNFSITKYFNSVKKILDETQQFILFTTNGMKISNETIFKLDGEQFNLKLVKNIDSGDSFDILRISKNIDFYYKFHIIEDKWTQRNPKKIQLYQTFFKSFRLYTNQVCFETLTKSTKDRFTKMFCSNEETFKKYVEVISDWSLKEGKKEKLSKKMTQRVIALGLLSSQIEPLVLGSVTDEMKILREAICLFEITLLEKEDSNAVQRLWGDLDKKIDLKELNKVRSLYSLSFDYVTRVENLDANLLTQLLWLMEKCPLIVKQHENIEKAVKLCPNAKFIILGERKYEKWMKELSVFQNLFNLKSKGELYDKVLQNFTISLQGKKAVNLVTSFEKNEEILKHVTVKKLLEMSNGACYIDGQKENFHNLYIDRYLSANIIDIKYLENVDPNTVIILEDVNSQQLNISEKYTITDVDPFLNKSDFNISDTPNFIISKDKCSESKFQKICSRTPKYKIVHYLKSHNKNLEWICSRGNINALRKYKLPNYSKNEHEVWSSEFINNINLITADPGMGKTELTKSLKNNCGVRYWTVILSRQDVLAFFRFSKKCEISDDLQRFETFILNQKYRHLGRLDREFFTVSLKQNNVIYIWDALDEIFTLYLNATIDLILMLSEKGFIQWVSARQHLSSLLKEKFNTFSVSINQFNEVDQEDYIKKRLTGFKTSGDMKTTIDRIKFTFANTNHTDILGIPLQIFMLTEVLLQNKENYLELLSNKFLLTDMYRYFIEGKFKFFYGGKVPVKDDYWEEEVRKKKEEKLKQYEKSALGVIFPEDILKELKIDCSHDINSVSEDFSTVGIVTGLQDGIPQFAHVSFAEYFVALYFSKNFGMIRSDIFFDQKYNNVRFFFDMLTGKNSPVHIAVLYRNFDEVKNCDDEIVKRKDDCGRSALHLICSWGQRHERLRVQQNNEGYVIETEQEINGLLETVEYSSALLFLLEKCEILEEALLLKITPLTCARASKSLEAELELLQSRKLQLGQSYCLNDRINILYYSALHGYAEAVKLVVEEKLSIDNYKEVNFIIKFDGSTPLIIASLEGHVTVAEYLVKCGAKVNSANNDDWTPLYGASRNGHEKTVESLVKFGAEINRGDKDGRTPLYAASVKGREKVVEYLVKCGAEINRTDKFGRTPLYGASENGHERTVECLVKYGAEINCADKYGWIPLYIASSNGHEKTVKCLVQCGAEINRADNIGRTPLYSASIKGLETTVDLLVKCGAEVNGVERRGWTPLYAASFNGHQKTVECLVKYGAEVNLGENYGRTPLHVASFNGHQKTVEYLAKHGAKVNRANKDGKTPLYLASLSSCEKIIACLVKCGADINYTDNDGCTPLYAASENGRTKIVEFLVKCGAEINRADTRGRTPLYAASLKGREQVIEWLVKLGAEINRADETGETPLYAASLYGHEKTVECLLKCGAEINRADKDGRTPVYAACLKGHEKVIKCLVKCGAEINRADKFGRTPLLVVSRCDQEKIVECLMKNGAEI